MIFGISEIGNFFGQIVLVDEPDPEDVVRRWRLRIEAGHSDGRLKSVHLDQSDDWNDSRFGGDLTECYFP